MTKITFNQIYTLGNVETENELYKHIHYPEMLLRYDSNFIEFKRMPSLTEFKNAVNYLREFHLKNGQKHIKFSFPANEKPAGELLEYMNDSAFMTGFTELYVIEPNQFPLVEENPDIEIQVVTKENLETYLNLQYQQDLGFGGKFADQKVALHIRNFADPQIQQLLALYKGVPAGSVDIIISKNTAEIDGLIVDESYQKKGIGSRLQKFVMEKYRDKLIILVADGEDTPREMYRRQNYQYRGFKYQTYKVYEL